MTTAIELSALHLPDLSDRRVVIIGGTGSVGEGVVRAWLDAQAEVIIPSRTDGRIAQFRAELAELTSHPKLRFITHDYTTFAGAEALAAAVTEQFGPVTDVVASIGGWWQGKPLWQVDEAEWQHFFMGLTTAHMATARAWIPRLAPTGSYQLILGGSATTPVPGSSIINMEQAALKMMHAVLAAEVGDQRRVFAQILGPVDTRQRQWVDPSWVSNTEVGLVSVGAGARSDYGSAQFTLRNKDQVLSTLRNLGLAQGGAQPEGQSSVPAESAATQGAY